MPSPPPPQHLQALLAGLDCLSPKKHRYFCKQYKVESPVHEIPLLLRDIEDYHLILNIQTKKIIATLQEYQLQGTLSQIVIGLLQCFEQLAAKDMQSLQRLAKRQDGSSEGVPKDNRCSDCSRMMSDYKVEQIMEELSLNKFQDRCGFFNVDHLNFSDHLDLAGLRKQSNSIIQSQLLTEDNQFEYKGGCISYEQYEEVLNLLGSDLHQKNSSIEKIIDYLSKTDKRLIDEDRFMEKEAQEEIRRMQSIVEGNGIKERLREIVKMFFNRYLKMKILKRKDCEVQANIKENDVIKDLQKEKKSLKGRIYQLSTEKERAAINYEGRIKMLQLQIESNNTNFKQEMEKNLNEISQLQQRFAQEYHLHELHRRELERLGNDHTALLALLSRRNINLNSRSKEPRSSGSNRSSKSLKKSKSKERIRLAKQAPNTADHNDRDSEPQISSKGEIPEPYHKLTPQEIQKAVENFTSLSDIARMQTYQKIEERQEQEQQGGQSSGFHVTSKRKTSRFKALMSHFNSNTTLHTEAVNPKLHRVTSINSSMLPLRHRPSTDNPPQNTEPQIYILKEPSGSKLSSQSRYDMLFKLFQNQRSNQQLNLQFPNFLQLYNDFITTVSEKVVSRSLSLQHELKKREMKQRVSILSSKLEHNTGKVIEERQASTASRKQGKMESDKSKSKLEPLEKKSQYYLKKTRSRKDYEFKSYSKTAEPTLRVDLQSTVSFKDIPQPIPIFTHEEIEQMFLGSDNIVNFQAQCRKADMQVASKGEQQMLMKLYAQLAKLHVNSCKDYEQVKTVLTHPNEYLSQLPIPSQSHIQTPLKTSIRHLILSHRPCRKEGHCGHLSLLLSRLQSLSLK